MKHMSTFKSKKLVKAFLIAEVQPCLGGAVLVPKEDIQPAYVNTMYMNKHMPQPGGYFVEYVDGYQSFSPAEAFETGYDLVSEGDEVEPEKEERKKIGLPDKPETDAKPKKKAAKKVATKKKVAKK